MWDKSKKRHHALCTPNYPCTFACENIMRYKETRCSIIASGFFDNLRALPLSSALVGRGGWIRTNEITDPETVALPLGDTPLSYCDVAFGRDDRI